MKKVKKIFLDTETTGISSYKNGIIQIGGIVEYDEIYEEFNINLQPFDDEVIEAQALAANNTTLDEIQTYQSAQDGYNVFMSILSKHIDPYDKNDKFNFIGYNSKFDLDFLTSFFYKNDNKFIGSYFYRPTLDLYPLVALRFMTTRHLIPNLKLGTAAAKMGITVAGDELHDALYDAKITREMFNVFAEELNVQNTGSK